MPRSGAATTLSRRAFLQGLACLALLPAYAGARPPLKLLASVYPVWLALLAVTGGLPDLETGLLAGAGTGCPHDYALTPRDRLRLEEADLLFLNGGGYEAFLESGLLSRLRAVKVDLGAGLAQADAELAFGRGEKGRDHDDHDDHGHGHGHDHGGGNPHYFACPRCFAGMAARAAEALGERIPSLARETAARASALAAEMAAVTRDLAALPADGVRLVLQHDTLTWFFRDSAFAVEAVVQEGDDEAPQAAKLVGLAERMSGGGRFLLVGDTQFPRQVLDTLAKETGAPAVFLDTLVSGPENPPEDWYARVMRANLQKLKACL